LGENGKKWRKCPKMRAKIETTFNYMPPKKYKTEEEAREAKALQDLERKRKRRKAKEYVKNNLTLKQKRFCELLPTAKSATQAAIDAGYSPKSAGESASENLKKSNVVEFLDKEEKNLKQAFNDFGLNEDYLAKNFKRVIDYNQEEIIELVGFGENAREVKKMRDAKVVSSTLVNVAKLSGASLENSRDTISTNISSDTALLAIKSLVKKLDAEGLKIVIESCEVLLANDAKIVD
jgi:phage terminase small subunit